MPENIIIFSKEILNRRIDGRCWRPGIVFIVGGGGNDVVTLLGENRNEQWHKSYKNPHPSQNCNIHDMDLHGAINYQGNEEDDCNVGTWSFLKTEGIRGENLVTMSHRKGGRGRAHVRQVLQCTYLWSHTN